MPARVQAVIAAAQRLGNGGERRPATGYAARLQGDRDRPGAVGLTNLDRAALAAYCGAYALWAESTEAIGKFGVMVKSPTGFPIQSPYVSIANRQAEIMMRIASEFGFTPASRGRISVPSESEPTLFDRLGTETAEEDAGN